MSSTIITDVWAREILDLLGNPTIEADIELEDGTIGRALFPAARRRVNTKRWSSAMATKCVTTAKAY